MLTVTHARSLQLAFMVAGWQNQVVFQRELCRYKLFAILMALKDTIRKNGRSLKGKKKSLSFMRVLIPAPYLCTVTFSVNRYLFQVVKPGLPSEA